MLTLIENGEIYAPALLGQNSILLGAGKILKFGAFSRQTVESLHIPTEVIDATDYIVTPGLSLPIPDQPW